MPFDFACKNIFIVGNFSTTWSLVEKETGASTRWGATMQRSKNVWTKTDNDRTGILRSMVGENFSFEEYVDYALKVPVYSIIRDGNYMNCLDYNFEDLMNYSFTSKLEENLDDISSGENVLSHSTCPPSSNLMRYALQISEHSSP